MDAGYYYEYEGENTIDDKLMIEQKADNCFEMAIPEGTNLILFSEKKEDIELCGDNGDNTKIYGYNSHDKCPGNSGFRCQKVLFQIVVVKMHKINAFRTHSRLDGLAHVTYNSCGVYTCRNLVTSSPYSSSLHIICAL